MNSRSEFDRILLPFLTSRSMGLSDHIPLRLLGVWVMAGWGLAILLATGCSESATEPPRRRCSMSLKKWIGMTTCALLIVALGCSSGDGSGMQSPGITIPRGTLGSTCGNGQLDSGEACDGSDLLGETCQGLGFESGTLSCGDSCTLDTAGCTPPEADRRAATARLIS